MDLNKILFKQALYLDVENKSTQKLIFKMDELTNCAIGGSVDETPIAGSGGTPIAILKTNKQATVTASNGYVVFDAIGAQAGQEKESGAFDLPWEQYIDITPGAAKVKLKYKAVGTTGAEFPYIYELNKDGSPNTEKPYPMSSKASATEFAYDPSTGEIELPTGFTGETVYVRYTAHTADALKVENVSNKFSLGGRVVIKWLAEDPCDEAKEYIVLTVLEKGSVSGTFDLAAGNDNQAHNIEIKALSSGCDTNKNLWTMYLLTEDGLEGI